MINHVQLACPPGSGDTLRGFYAGVLGFQELARPPVLAARGGCWFGGHGIELHLGVEYGFRPARTAEGGAPKASVARAVPGKVHRQVDAVNAASLLMRSTMSSWTASVGRAPSTVNIHSRPA
jgi:hypothetical protein